MDFWVLLQYFYSFPLHTNENWANCPDDRKFIGGYAIFLSSNLISWSFRNQHSIAPPSTVQSILQLLVLPLKCIATTDQPANGLRKALPRNKFHNLQFKLNDCDSKLGLRALLTSSKLKSLPSL